MNDIKARKFYIRHREGYPETEMQDCARRGMWEQNVETAAFEWTDDIDNMADLGPEVGIAGYIGDIWRGLKKLGVPIPPNVDYPEKLTDFLGRKIWQGTLGEVRASTSPLFVKPVEQKLFTGFLWQGASDFQSRRRVVTHPDETPCWISEPAQMVAEFRSMILYRRILDVRRYKGDWSKAPSRDIIEAAVRAMGRKAPHSYCLDWAVTDDGRTILVEMNEGYAFGHYGASHINYAKMLAARWWQLVSGKDVEGPHAD